MLATKAMLNIKQNILSSIDISERFGGASSVHGFRIGLLQSSFSLNQTNVKLTLWTQNAAESRPNANVDSICCTNVPIAFFLKNKIKVN